MICLDVYLNGEKVCRAGREDLVVLNAIMNWVTPDEGPAEMNFHVGGLSKHDSGGSVHLRWGNDKNISFGDELTMRFVEAGSADEPTYEKTESREWIEQQERAYYEHMKAKYENI